MSQSAQSDIISKQLRKLRKAKKENQETVANNINISRTALANYENGNRTPDYDILVKLANYYGVSCDYIIREVKSEFAEIHKTTGLSEEAIIALNDYITNFSFIELQEQTNNTTVKKDGNETIFETPKQSDLFRKMDAVNFFLGFNPEDDGIDEYFRRFTRIIYDYRNGITANIKIKKEFNPLLSHYIEQLKADTSIDYMPYEFPDYLRDINDSEKEMRYRTFELQGLMLDFIDDFFAKEKAEYNKADLEYKRLDKECKKLKAANKETREQKKKGR